MEATGRVSALLSQAMRKTQKSSLHTGAWRGGRVYNLAYCELCSLPGSPIWEMLE